MQVSLNMKMAGQVKKRNKIMRQKLLGTTVVVRKSMMIKNAEQTNVTWQKNTASPTANVWRWKQHKRKLAVHRNCLFLWIQG
jgi:hypothetical protein